jgi:hypothetical protein
MNDKFYLKNLFFVSQKKFNLLIYMKINRTFKLGKNQDKLFLCNYFYISFFFLF